ncbi:hypothetical protein ABPG72_019717 [Tetrahymena utriculariae]
MKFLTQEEVAKLYSLIQLEPLKENQCRLQYIQTAAAKYQEHIPFQNVFLLSTPVDQRRPLTFDEIKNLVLSGQGGFCQVMNVFFNSFLQTLGYESYILNSSYAKIPDNHVVIIVKNVLNQGDSYLVDVGSGNFQYAIELNFEDKSPVYNFLYTKCYLQWDQDKKDIILFHINRNDESNHIYSFNLTPIKDFQSLSFQNHIYTNPKITPFHNILRILRFPQSGAICIVDKTLLKENGQHRLKPEIGQFINDQEYLNTVKKYFGNLDLIQCQIAYNSLFQNP